MSLSKTDYMRGMQCPRMLWLDSHHPDWKIIPPDTQERLDFGNEFGDKAMGMFGPFEEMTEYLPNTNYPNKRKMVLNTKHHLQSGTENICEAAFENNGLYCAADIIHKVPGGYEMYEVKNAPEVKDQFVKDAGYQAYVIQKCGIHLTKVFIVYNNGDEYDPFEPVDVSEEAFGYAKVVEENVDRLKAVKDQKTEVIAEPGTQCMCPYPCWYQHVCRRTVDG